MFAGLTGWHVIFLLFMILPFVLWIIAIVQIARTPASGTAIAVWILIVTLVPLVGAILWFAIGRRTAAQPPAGTVP
ncbi:MAG TPA: PLDc N-terminal domain-containing protein [Microbacteriaceae bacterium]